MTLLRIFDVRNVLIALTAAIVALAGCSSGVLTIESGDTPPEQFAAEELRKYIGLLSETTPDLTFRIGTRYLELFPDDRSFLQNGDGYEVTLSIDLESLGVELTKFNLCGVAFARMSTTERKKGKPTFSAWKGVHPLCTADFEEVVLSCE